MYYLDKASQLKSYKSSFWSKVKFGDTTDDCWEWTASKSKQGYGKFWAKYVHDGTLLSHRVSWMLENNRWLDSDVVVRHTCDNPSCVNPNHLIIGTQKDNEQDTYNRNPRYLTNAQVKNVKERYATGLYSQSELAKQFGQSQISISRLVRGVRRNGG